MIDQLPLKPLGYNMRISALAESYDMDNPNPELVETHLRANIERLMPVAVKTDELIAAFNRDFSMAVASQDTALSEAMLADAAVLSLKIFDAYKLIQDEFLKLSPALNGGFANVWVQNNITHLDAAVKLLEAGNADAAVYDELAAVDLVKASIYFDKETCNFFNLQSTEGLAGTWAEGRTIGLPCYADAAVRSLLEKIKTEDTDYMPEIEALKALSDEQRDLLSSIYDDQSASCYRIADAMYAIMDAKAELDSAKEDQQSLGGGK
jgi:hypothetical protein